MTLQMVTENKFEHIFDDVCCIKVDVSSYWHSTVIKRLISNSFLKKL